MICQEILYPPPKNSRLVKSIAGQFPKTAEYTRQILARMSSFAIRNLRAKSNPAREIQGAVMVPAAVHHKPIAAKDIPGFIDKIDGYAGRARTKIAAKLLLLEMLQWWADFVDRPPNVVQMPKRG